MLTCITTSGCTGVQSGSISGAISSAAAYESNRFAGFQNNIAIMITANVPLQQTKSTVTVSGIFGNSVGSGPETLLLSRCPGVISRAALCNSTQECTVFLDSSPPPATLRTFSLLNVTMSCSVIVPGQVS